MGFAGPSAVGSEKRGVTLLNAGPTTREPPERPPTERGAGFGSWGAGGHETSQWKRSELDALVRSSGERSRLKGSVWGSPGRKWCSKPPTMRNQSREAPGLKAGTGQLSAAREWREDQPGVFSLNE